MNLEIPRHCHHGMNPAEIVFKTCDPPIANEIRSDVARKMVEVPH